MRAALGYRSPGYHHRTSLSCGILEEEDEKMTSSSLLSMNRDADRFISGRDGHVQSHSALNILQQQLDSFQNFRQQTLQNVNMVQSEIRGILNKNIADLKNPECNLNDTFLTSRPVNSNMLRECQETSRYKKLHHLNKRFGTSQNSDVSSGTTLTDEDISHQILSKYEKAGNHTQMIRDKASLALSDDHKPKNSTSRYCSSYCSGLLSETKNPPREIKDGSFHRYGEDDNECLTESASFSLRDMKEEHKKTLRLDPSYMFEFQNSPNLLYSKDNDSGYLSEQDLTEKTADSSSEDLKSNRIVPVSMMCATPSSYSTARTESESTFQISGDSIDKMPLRFLPRVVEDEYTARGERDQRKQLLEFQKHDDVTFGNTNAASDDCYMRLLQTSLKDPGYLQKKLIDLEHENADLRKQINPLTAIIQSLTEQNSKYQNQIRSLHDEKNDMQGKLIKSDGDCKECLKEVKRLLKKCKELQQQKINLEEKQNQLYAQNQKTIRNLTEIQNKAQESVAILRREKGDLTVTLKALEKQVSTFHEENSMLGAKISQLAENKSLLEQELGEKQNEIEQMKRHEKSAIADMQALVEMIESLKNEKSNLNQKFQESLEVKESLQRELEEAQTGRTHAEETLVTECKSAKMETGVLQIKLSNMEKECERLKQGVAITTEENRFLKKELNEHKQEASEWKNKIRRLNEELLLMENKMCSTSNERDVLQFEVHRLQKNTAGLQDQLTTLVREQYKKYCAGNRGQNYQSERITETCEEISSYQHFAFVHIPPGNSRQTPTIYPSEKQ